MGLKTTSRLPELRLALGDELLRVHKNYQPAIASFDRERSTPRPISPAEASSTTCLACCPRTVRPIFAVVPGGPPIFKIIQRGGDVSALEMYQVFNMGIGMVLIVPKKHEAEVAHKTHGRVVGEIVEGPKPWR